MGLKETKELIILIVSFKFARSLASKATATTYSDTTFFLGTIKLCDLAKFLPEFGAGRHCLQLFYSVELHPIHLEKSRLFFIEFVLKLPTSRVRSESEETMARFKCQ